MSNYPDGLSEGSPYAPWNYPDPLTCDQCGFMDESDAYEGDDCPECDDGTLDTPV